MSLIVIGLELEGSEVPVINLIGLGVFHFYNHDPGFSLLIQDVVVHLPEEAGGGDGDIFRMEHHLLRVGAVKDVLAQVIVAVPIEVAQNTDIPLCFIVKNVLTIGGLVCPQSRVKDGSGGPVAEESQEGQTDLGMFLLRIGQDDEALYVSTVLEGFAQLRFLRVGEGDHLFHLGVTGSGDGHLPQIHFPQKHIVGQHHVPFAVLGVHRVGVGHQEDCLHVIGCGQ